MLPALLLGGLAAVALFSMDGVISRTQGWVLIAFYASYLISLAIWQSRQEPVEHAPEHPVSRDILWLVLGLAVLLASAELTVSHAVDFAEHVGMTQLSVSAVIIGMGSSLPELSVSLVALMK